jgi:hypothetical protein
MPLVLTRQSISYGTHSARAVAFLAFFLFVSPTNAQIEAPKPNRRTFLAGVCLLAAAKTADAISTRQLLDRGGWENNSLFGRYPSPAKQAGINAAMFAGQTAVFYFTERSRHAWVRWTGRTWLGLTVANHARLAFCNASIDTRGSVTNCHDWPGL